MVPGSPPNASLGSFFADIFVCRICAGATQNGPLAVTSESLGRQFRKRERGSGGWKSNWIAKRPPRQPVQFIKHSVLIFSRTFVPAQRTSAGIRRQGAAKVRHCENRNGRNSTPRSYAPSKQDDNDEDVGMPALCYAGREFGTIGRTWRKEFDCFTPPREFARRIFLGPGPPRLYNCQPRQNNRR